MSWWNRYKKKVIILTVSVICLSSLLYIAFAYYQISTGNVFCTMADCIGDGVHVVFTGYTPKNYSVEIGFPSGKRKISCPSSMSPKHSEADQCTVNGVFFEQLDSKGSKDKPPKKLRVTVEFDGKRISRTFFPAYEFFYMNGEGCGPMCYYATIEFDLSE